MALIVSLFFLWGVANNLNDVLVAHFREAFSLSDLQSGLVQSAFYLGYFVFALPAALFSQRYGYKAAVVLGLCLYGAGALLFAPAAQVRVYAAFLGALFVIASGLAFLESAANPLITVLGASQGAQRRLNFAQAFNPLGAIVGVLVGRAFILAAPARSSASAAAVDAHRIQAALAVRGPYLAIGAFVLAWAALTAFVRFPAEAGAPPRAAARRSTTDDLPRLLQSPRFAAGLAAQFAYVGAQVGVWSFLIRYARSALPMVSDQGAAVWLTGSLALFMAGRFAGTAALAHVRAGTLLSACGVAACALCLVAALVGGRAGLLALTATSFFMSIMYPTIFATAIEGLGERTKLGASLLVMMIVGGAAIPAFMGRVSDLTSIATAMLAPAAAFAGVAAFGLTDGRARRDLAAEGLPA